MITKLLCDHVVKTSPFCGAIHEILTGAEYSPSIALAIDIRETVPISIGPSTRSISGSTVKSR